MKKIINYIKNHKLLLYIIINILYIFISSFLVVIWRHYKYNTFGKSMIIAFVLNLIISIIIFINHKFYKKDYIFKYCDLLLILITIFSIISLIFAKKIEIAIFGETIRYEGIFALLYYLSLFYLSSFINKKDKKIIVYVIIFTGFFQAMFAILQKAQSPLVRTVRHNRDIWAVGFTNNPNFLGSYMLMCLSLTIGLFVDENDWFRKLLIYIVSIVILGGLLASDTMSCIVGLFGVFILLLVYIIKIKKYKEFLIIILSFISLLFFFQKGRLTHLVDDIIKTKNETVEISKGNIKEEYGTKRIVIWKETLKIVPKYLWHGVGIDNFSYAFDGKALTYKNLVFDKAHNEYLQTLITQGIFSFISYLLFYALIVIDGIKNHFKKDKIYLLLPVVGYLIQAFFNISVIEVAPIFFILLGLQIERGINTKKVSK